ncbi:Uncharacterised protein [Mycobacterium tuberculosis]|uniref:Uncharacterized protein n=1 Tax=Mycobacterium tuberculosis TaxID=1773 RepID=A0A916LEF0_MYCTX|nr:Uncharacterised protein [Mycobacterium tuberculosis]
MVTNPPVAITLIQSAPRAARSWRIVVIPERNAAAACRRARPTSTAWGSPAKSSGLPSGSQHKCACASTRPGNKVDSPRSTRFISGQAEPAKSTALIRPSSTTTSTGPR